MHHDFTLKVHVDAHHNLLLSQHTRQWYNLKVLLELQQSIESFLQVCEIGGSALCHYSGIMMLFFGIATMAVVFMMSVERMIAVRFAFFYRVSTLDLARSNKSRIIYMVYVNVKKGKK